MYRFKRDNTVVEHARQVAEMVDEDKSFHINLLIKKYEEATFSEWSDKSKFTVDAIEDFVNDFGFADDAIAENMANNHPTLQQSFMRLCVKFIKKMSEKQYFDGRNEAAVKMAKQMMEAIGNDTGLPCV